MNREITNGSPFKSLSGSLFGTAKTLFEKMQDAGLTAFYSPYQIAGIEDSQPLLNAVISGVTKDIFRFNPAVIRQYSIASGGAYETSAALLDPKTIPVLLPKMYDISGNAKDAVQTTQANQPSIWVHNADNPFQLPDFEVNTSVTSLSLTIRGLTGNIPASIGNLTNLTALSFYTNQLSGSIPAEIGNLTNLATLNLGSNQLSGSIPAEIGNLTKLTSLNLYSNQLSGSIPVEIGNLTQLTVFSLYINQLSGSIPVEISNLTNLTTLFLYANQLSGSIPVEISNLTNLTALNLGSNQLSGAIPAAIGNLTNLATLHLYANQLSGVIPTEIGNLTKLTTLSLYSNQLSGVIPAGIAAIPTIKYISLNNCQFSQTDLSNFVTALWNNRVQLRLNACSVTISANNGLTADAIARIEGTGTYAGDGLKPLCTVTY